MLINIRRYHEQATSTAPRYPCRPPPTWPSPPHSHSSTFQTGICGGGRMQTWPQPTLLGPPLQPRPNDILNPRVLNTLCSYLRLQAVSMSCAHRLSVTAPANTGMRMSTLDVRTHHSTTSHLGRQSICGASWLGLPPSCPHPFLASVHATAGAARAR